LRRCAGGHPAVPGASRVRVQRRGHWWDATGRRGATRRGCAALPAPWPAQDDVRFGAAQAGERCLCDAKRFLRDSSRICKVHIVGDPPREARYTVGLPDVRRGAAWQLLQLHLSRLVPRPPPHTLRLTRTARPSACPPPPAAAAWPAAARRPTAWAARAACLGTPSARAALSASAPSLPPRRRGPHRRLLWPMDTPQATLRKKKKKKGSCQRCPAGLAPRAGDMHPR
jgi:hypothetical protein